MTVTDILSSHSAQSLAGEREALLSSSALLLRKLESAPCDEPGVSGCVRCNAVYLAKRVAALVALNDEAEVTQTHHHTTGEKG